MFTSPPARSTRSSLRTLPGEVSCISGNLRRDSGHSPHRHRYMTPIQRLQHRQSDDVSGPRRPSFSHPCISTGPPMSFFTDPLRTRRCSPCSLIQNTHTPTRDLFVLLFTGIRALLSTKELGYPPGRSPDPPKEDPPGPLRAEDDKGSGRTAMCHSRLLVERFCKRCDIDRQANMSKEDDPRACSRRTSFSQMLTTSPNEQP